MTVQTETQPTGTMLPTDSMLARLEKLVVLAIDLGTTFLAASACIGKVRFVDIRCPDNGEQTPSVMFVDSEGKAIVGKKALQMALAAPEQFFALDKRWMETQPNEPVRPGGLSATQCAAEKLRHMTNVARQTIPEVDQAFQDGSLYVVVTIPANSSVLHKQAVMEAGALAGLNIQQLFPEPVAATQWFLQEHGGQLLLEGQRVLICDLGGGTYDLTVCEFRRDKFHEVAVTGNSIIGGLTFTGALYLSICDRLQLPELKAYYDPTTGFDTLAVDADTAALRLPFKLWNAADLIKCSLSVNDHASELVELPGGTVETISYSRDEFLLLVDEAYDEICKTTVSAIEQHGSVDHILLVGGSSMLFSLRDRLANALSVPVEAIRMQADSRNLIANGACHMVVSDAVEDADHVVTRGFVVRVEVRHADGSTDVMYRVLVSPGQVIPATGITVENTGQFLDSQSGSVRLELVFAETKEGVRVPENNGAAVLLPAEDVIEIQRIVRDVAMPKGSHELVLEVHSTRGDTSWALRALNLPDMETIHGSILKPGEHDHGEPEAGGYFDVVIAADLSGSMASNLDAAKDVMKSFAEQCPPSVRLGLIGFGSHAEVHAQLGTGVAPLIAKIDGLKANGGTNMADAIELAKRQFDDSAREQVIVLYTDGLPSSKKSTRAAVEAVRADGIRLIAVSLGDQSDDEFLAQNVAACSGDFYPCGDIAGLPDVFQQIAASIYVR